MAATPVVSNTRTRSKSNPNFQRSIKASEAVDPTELRRRLELYRLEEETKKKHRRKSAGRYLSDQPLSKDHGLSFNIAEFNNNHLVRSLEFHRRSFHAESQLQRSKSAHASQGRSRSTAVEADELTRRLEAYLNSYQKEQRTTYASSRPKPPASPYANAGTTRSRTHCQKRLKPLRPELLPPVSQPPYHHTPTVAALSLSSSAITDAFDATKAHRLSHNVLHRDANPSTAYAAPEGGHNSHTLAAARRQTQAHNDALTARNNFQDPALTAEAALHDRQHRQRRDGGKAPNRAEREARREQRSLDGSSGGNGNAGRKPRPRSLPRPSTIVHRSNSRRRARFDSPQEDVPPIPRRPRLASDKNDWTQADEAVALGGPGRLSITGLARRLSRRSGASSTSGAGTGTGHRSDVVPPTPTVVVNDEAKRWRGMALVMREEGVGRARALGEERERGEWMEGTGGDRARRKSTVGARSGVADAAAVAACPAIAAPPPAAAPLPPSPVAVRPQGKRMTSDWAVESGTEHMTRESRRLLEKQTKLLRRRTLEEKALRATSVEKEREKDGLLEAPDGLPGGGLVSAPTKLIGQQERAASQRSAVVEEKVTGDGVADEKPRGVGETLKVADAQRRKRRGCFGMLWS